MTTNPHRKAFRKPEAAIRYLRRELAKARLIANETNIEVYKQSARAEDAEKELAEWKQRFDLLLRERVKS